MARAVEADAVREAWSLKREWKSQDEIASAIHRSLRQTQNYLNRHWLKERGLESLAYSEQAVSLMEREADGRCGRGDHSFMDDYLFEWHAYRIRTDRTSIGTCRVKQDVKVCNFCGLGVHGRRSFASVS